MKQDEAYMKGRKIVISCENSFHITGAYNYIDNFRKMFGKTNLWKRLYDFCSNKRRRIENE